jgi:NADPH:quinone reductase-like Zn-dependent oxidoreductase
MKAMVCANYGLDSLKFDDIPKPTPGDNEVLVEVHASSITVHNLGLVRGKPFFTRLIGSGLLKPRRKIPGSDMAG